MRSDTASDVLDLVEAPVGIINTDATAIQVAEDGLSSFRIAMTRASRIVRYVLAHPPADAPQFRSSGAPRGVVNYGHVDLTPYIEAGAMDVASPYRFSLDRKHDGSSVSLVVFKHVGETHGPSDDGVVAARKFDVGSLRSVVLASDNDEEVFPAIRYVSSDVLPDAVTEAVERRVIHELITPALHGLEGDEPIVPLLQVVRPPRSLFEDYDMSSVRIVRLAQLREEFPVVDDSVRARTLHPLELVLRSREDSYVAVHTVALSEE